MTLTSGNRSLRCPQCRARTSSSANFCEQCGTRLRAVPPSMALSDELRSDCVAEDAAEPPLVDGERKLVTALTADVKDSVKLIGGLDPEQAHRIVHTLLRLMIDSVVEFDGYILQTAGDGIYAVFGAPAAYRDHALRAVYAALKMQNSLQAYRLAKADEPSIEVRIGIDSGEVVLRRLDIGRAPDYIIVGQTANLAARLQGVTRPGTIAIGEQTRQLVEGYFDLKALPPVMLKGIADPVPIYEVCGLGRLRRHSQISARRDFSKFVGRATEIERLQRALETAEAGKGQLVAVVTGAGTGKSRLLFEFSKTLPLNCKIVESYAVSHESKTAWHPVISMLQDYFGILESDDPKTRRCRISDMLAAIGVEPSEVQPLLFVLLGIVDGADDPLAQMDPRVRRTRTIDAISRVFVAESRRQPVVLIFEDLHWADEQTRILLGRLVEDIAQQRILVLTTCWPEYLPDWSAHRHVSEIRLQPLSVESSEALLTSLLGDDPELAWLKQLIVERTGGNPFFIEEMVNSLLEDGTLRRGGPAKLTRPPGALRVPMTIRGLLAERIDQAAPRAKEMLQLLSVIGQGLPIALVLKASRWPAQQTEKLLSDLEAGDFIYARAAIQVGQNTVDYAFKHVLTQDVAYHSMLLDQRKQLHRRVGAAIEAVYQDNLNDHLTALMYHFAASDDHRKAIEYLGKAALQAIARSAHQDAIHLIRQALSRITLLPPGTIGAAEAAALWSALGIALQVAHGYASEEVGLAYAKAREFSLQARDDLGLVIALRGNFLFHTTRAEYEHAVQAGRDLVRLGNGNNSYALEGYVSLGLTHEYIGDFKYSEDYFTKALGLEAASALAEQVQYSGHSRAICRSYAALSLVFLGQFDRALALSEEALSLSKMLSLPITTAQSLGVHGVVLHKLRAYRAAETFYDEAIACATQHGFPYWLTLASMLRSSLLMSSGDVASNLADFEQGLAGYRSTGARLGMSWYLLLRAEQLAKAGLIDDALAATSQAMAFITETGERMNEANAHRLQGELLFHQYRLGNGQGLDEAEASFVTSLTIASRQQAKLWELRAATSLACVRVLQRRFDDGFEVLSRVYDSFTEGFAMPDLVDARHLIEYLGQSGAGPFPISDVGGSALLPVQ